MTVSGFRYHPLPSGARSAAAVTVGAVPSYLSPTDVGALVFPALSRHVPETCADALSEAYVGRSHAASPEVASLPENTTATGRVYQPLASGERSGAAAVTCGGVASRFTCAVHPYVALP